MVRQASAAPLPGSTARRWRTACACTLAAVAALRAWCAAALPLSGDEAYYWEWSRHLALGYYDHPPLVAWAIALSTRWLPAGSELAVRLPAIAALLLCALVCRGLALRLAAPLGLAGAAAERCACVAALLVLAVPILAFFGVYASGDALLFLCWALAMDQGWRAAVEGSRRACLGLGLAAGAGMLTKFLFALFAPAYALFLLLSPARRAWLRKPEPWLAAGLALLVNAPFLDWSATHGWITFRFNLLDRHRLVPGWAAFLELAGTQAAVLTPVVFLWAAAASARILRRWRTAAAAELYLALLFAVPMSAFAVASLGGTQVGASWPTAAALGGCVLLAGRSEHVRAERGLRAARGALLATLGLAALVSALGYALLLLPPTSIERLALRHPTREKHFRDVRLSELYGWRELGQRVAVVRAELLAAQPPAERGVFLLAAQYGVCAQVAFSTPGQPAVLLWDPPRRHGQAYRAWDRFEPLRGQDALFVTKHERHLARSLAELREHFARVHDTERFSVLHAGREVRAFYLVRCEGFDGAAPSFP